MERDKTNGRCKAYSSTPMRDAYATFVHYSVAYRQTMVLLSSSLTYHLRFNDQEDEVVASQRGTASVPIGWLVRLAQLASFNTTASDWLTIDDLADDVAGNTLVGQQGP